MSAPFGIVFRKELRDHLRDRRSLTGVVFGSLVGPILFGVMFTIIASWSRQDKPLEVPIIGRAHAPALIAYLERSGAKVTEAPSDYEDRVRAGTLDLTLIIPEDFGKKFAAGQSARLQLVSDSSRNKARANVRRLQLLLSSYSGSLAAQRLLLRGVAPELASPLQLEDVDLATPERLAATLLNIIPLFLVIACFMGGMNVAIDATAGERERGSLESLLLHPAQRVQLVIGKWLATVAFSFAMVLLALAAFMIVAKRVPLQDLGVKVTLSPDTALLMVVALLPLLLLAGAVQMLVATFARSYKEGQTYLQLLLLLPTVPATLLAISPIQSKPWMFAVPVMGQELLLSELMRAEPLNATPFLLSALSGAVLTAACVAFTSRMLGDERIVFGRS